jgi:hypothetical protein
MQKTVVANLATTVFIADSIVTSAVQLAVRCDLIDEVAD